VGFDFRALYGLGFLLNGEAGSLIVWLAQALVFVRIEEAIIGAFGADWLLVGESCWYSLIFVQRSLITFPRAQVNVRGTEAQGLGYALWDLPP